MASKLLLVLLLQQVSSKIRKYNTSLHRMYILAPADYEVTVRQLTFSPTVNVNPVPVNIINDGIHEDNETFFGNLAAAGQPVDLNPGIAVVTIIDDIDRKLPCCNGSVHVR